MMRFAPLEDWYRDRYFADVVDISGSGVYDYSHKQLREMTDWSLESLDDLVFHDNPTFGDLANREIIANRWGTGDSSRVVTCNGSNESLALIMNAALEVGDEVVSLFPCYHCHDRIAEHLGCTVKYWKLNPDEQFRPDFEQLSALVTAKTKMVVVNFPHNPTGTHLTQAELTQLVDIVSAVDAYLVWDAAFEDLQFDNKLPSPLNMYPKCIASGTFSKAYGFPGMRFGWCIIPECLDRGAQIYKDYTNLYVSPIVEAMAHRVLSHIDKFYLPRLDEVSTNRQIVIEWLNKHQQHFDFQEPSAVSPKGGVTCFPRYKGAMSSQQLCEYLFEKHDLLLVPGECFELEDHVRIGFGVPTERLVKGLERLHQALESL